MAREEVAVSGEAENLVTVFRGGPKALSGGVEASSGVRGVGYVASKNKAAEEGKVKGA